MEEQITTLTESVAALEASAVGMGPWLLTATALVLFMTIPGLALFYGGLVRAKNYLSVLMQCMAITGVVTITWMVAGYALSSTDGNALFGTDFSQLLFWATPQADLAGAAFGLTFAVITPALILGAYAERVKFSFVLAFSVLWSLLVYCPLAYWVWMTPEGSPLTLITNGLHPIDYAGGLVVHQSAGVAALVLAILLGKRAGFPSAMQPPAQPGMVMIGASMLWVGWYGFNSGLAGDMTEGGYIIFNTQVCTATAVIAWVAFETIRGGKPTLVGAATGAVAGLVAITPACATVSVPGALILGVVAGVVPQLVIPLVKSTFKIDDALDVFAVHGVAGISGTLLLPFLALIGTNGTPADDTGAQFIAQLWSVIASGVYVVIATLIIAFVVRAIFGMRAEDEAVADGLDLSSHGERAYDLS